MLRWWKRPSPPPGTEKEDGPGARDASQAQEGEAAKAGRAKKKMSTKLPLTYDPEEDLSMPEMKVSDDELALNQIPLRARDVCAHLLLEMKRCQRREMYLPWKCEHEKHNYEACKLSDVVRRRKLYLKEEAERSTAATVAADGRKEDGEGNKATSKGMAKEEGHGEDVYKLTASDFVGMIDTDEEQWPWSYAEAPPSHQVDSKRADELSTVIHLNSDEVAILLDEEDDERAVLSTPLPSESAIVKPHAERAAGDGSMLDEQQLHKVQAALHEANRSLVCLQQETLAKDGEVAILRQKLSALERERYECTQRYASKLETVQAEGAALQSHWQRENDRLLAQIAFNENEAMIHSNARQVRSKSPSAADAPLTRTFPKESHENDTRPPDGGGHQNNSKFAESFSDLTQNAKSRTASSLAKRPKAQFEQTTEREATNCSRSPPSSHEGEEDCIDLERELTEIMYKSIGYADRLWALDDFADADRQVAKEWKEVLLEIASHTRDVFIAIECMYVRASRSPRNVLTFYFSTIIEYMVCLHPNVAALLSTTIPSVAAIGGAVESPPKPIGITDLPERAALLEAMCTFFAKLPRDTSATLVHQHLRIFKHVLAGSRQPDVPQCLIELVERGSLGEKLEFFHASHEEILLDCIQMLSLMTSDRRLALALVKHAGASSEYSMLNVLNRILSMRLALKAPHEKADDLDQALVILLNDFVSKRLLPTSVAFEPAVLRLMCRRLAQAAWRVKEGEDVTQCIADLAVFLQILARIIIAEAAPIVNLARQEIFNLVFAVRTLAKASSIALHLQPYLADLLPHLDTELCHLMAGRYCPLPTPPFQRQRVALTVEEEVEAYRRESVAQL